MKVSCTPTTDITLRCAALQDRLGLCGTEEQRSKNPQQLLLMLRLCGPMAQLQHVRSLLQQPQLQELLQAVAGQLMTLVLWVADMPQQALLLWQLVPAVAALTSVAAQVGPLKEKLPTGPPWACSLGEKEVGKVLLGLAKGLKRAVAGQEEAMPCGLEREECGRLLCDMLQLAEIWLCPGLTAPELLEMEVQQLLLLGLGSSGSHVHAMSASKAGGASGGISSEVLAGIRSRAAQLVLGCARGLAVAKVLQQPGSRPGSSAVLHYEQGWLQQQQARNWRAEMRMLWTLVVGPCYSRPVITLAKECRVSGGRQLLGYSVQALGWSPWPSILRPAGAALAVCVRRHRCCIPCIQDPSSAEQYKGRLQHQQPGSAYLPRLLPVINALASPQAMLVVTRYMLARCWCSCIIRCDVMQCFAPTC
jgi:hypothetical protein